MHAIVTTGWWLAVSDGDTMTSMDEGMHLGASFAIDFGHSVKTMAKQLAIQNRLLQPARYPVAQATYFPASGGTTPFLVSLGEQFSPSIGRVWQVVAITLTGTDDHSAVVPVGSQGTLNQLAALGASPATSFNNNPVGVYQTVSGGTVSAIAVNGTTTGLTSGTFFIPAGGTITVTYTVLPTTFTTSLPFGVTIPGNSSATPITASIFAGPSSGLQGGGNLADRNALVAANVSIPYVNLVGKDRIWMDSDDQFYAWIYGTIPASQQFVLTIDVDDYPVIAKETLAL